MQGNQNQGLMRSIQWQRFVKALAPEEEENKRKEEEREGKLKGEDVMNFYNELTAEVKAEKPEVKKEIKTENAGNNKIKMEGRRCEENCIIDITEEEEIT